MAHRIIIDVFGHNFVFETPGPESDAVEAKKLVEDEIAKAMTRMGESRVGKEVTVILMAALSLASDYLEMRNSRDATLSEVRKRLTDLAEKSENLYAGGF